MKEEEFISDLLYIHTNELWSLEEKYSRLRGVLNRFTLLWTKEDGITYPNLSSRLDGVIRRTELKPIHRYRLHAFRIKSNQLKKMAIELPLDEYLWELYSLYTLLLTREGSKGEQRAFELLFGVKMPEREPYAKPKDGQAEKPHRSIVPALFLRESLDSPAQFFVTREDHIEQEWLVELKDPQPFIQHLYQGVALNLIFNRGEKFDEDKTLRPDLVVVEPNYLIDISALADLYKPYGTHPANMIIKRLTSAENTIPLLLGNIANFFLDTLVNEPDDEPVTYKETIKQAFRESPFDISTCSDLNNTLKAREFFQNTEIQFNNIATIVRETFKNPGYNIDRRKAVLEPTFICQTLGLQGRLDLMLDDFSQFIELKSGRADDFKPPIKHQESHYVQMLLYFEVLSFNTGRDWKEIQAYLLYSKHALLFPEKPFFSLVVEAINIRNLVVLNESQIHLHNSAQFTLEKIREVDAQNLNIKEITGRYWDIIKQPIEQINEGLDSLTPLELTYFARLYTFVSKELYISKVGGSTSHDTHKGVSMLWDALPEEKIEAGELLYDLRVESSIIENNRHSVNLSIPQYEIDMLPNFRVGDAVILYARSKPQDNVTNREVIKGNIEQISSSNILITLRTVQRHGQLFRSELTFAIEKDHIDVAYSQMFRALGAFLNADPQRRDMLLNGSQPSEIDAADIDDRSSDLDRIVQKVIKAKDYFLLVGPPGTGKTSQALRRMVDHYYNSGNNNILLLSYTNRAVDEICQMLEGFSPKIEYIRISSESSCEEEYREHLLDSTLKDAKDRRQVKDKLTACRIYVGTVSSISNKQAIFNLKKFQIAIVDEATQLLEPQLLPLIVARNEQGENAIEKFVLIGDHKQLPAVLVQSPQESAVPEPELQSIGLYNLKESLFERLYRKALAQGDSSHYDMLVRTGRMHPDVAAFPNKFFYEGKLAPIPLPHQGESLPFVTMHADPIKQIIATERIALFDTPLDSNSHSVKVSRNEASMVATIVKHIEELHRESNLKLNNSQQIGIITPYRTQIAQIRRSLIEASVAGAEDMLIDTVERFQGSQRDIIIFSFCVNRKYQLSFLCNTMEENGYQVDRKLNVAMTRARKQLFLVGNRELLMNNTIYANLIKHLDENSH
ncbi:MAG: DEAD/DEAH box helicase [Bacteroidales bacterium]